MTDPDLEVTRIRRFGTIVARKRSDGSISMACTLFVTRGWTSSATII